MTDALPVFLISPVISKAIVLDILTTKVTEPTVDGYRFKEI
ncbi:MAG: hypothetical protein ACU84H_07925 [Gammaproteobacteria bacterium]